MPRAFTLADVFQSLNDDVQDALSVDDTVEVITQLISITDDIQVAETYTIPAPAANNSNWGTAVWGEFLWS